MICPHCHKDTHTKWFSEGVGQCNTVKVIEYEEIKTQMSMKN